MYDMHLEMEIEGFYCNSWPKFTIKQNNKTIYEEFVINSQKVDMQIEDKPFTIGMKNKSGRKVPNCVPKSKGRSRGK